MNPKIFESAILIIKNYYDSNEPNFNTEDIISDLWSKAIDVVFLKYKTPKFIVSEFYRRIEKINYDELKIKPFADYKAIQNLPYKKILVTTGLKELQIAKIKALNIESDFEAIKIDDPRVNPRQNKLDIFKQILKETKILPEEIWVIGDNPESEIKAGKKLGMNTIQRKSNSKESSEYSDYQIESFEELKNIIK